MVPNSMCSYRKCLCTNLAGKNTKVLAWEGKMRKMTITPTLSLCHCTLQRQILSKKSTISMLFTTIFGSVRFPQRKVQYQCCLLPFLAVSDFPREKGNINIVYHYTQQCQISPEKRTILTLYHPTLQCHIFPREKDNINSLPPYSAMSHFP